MNHDPATLAGHYSRFRVSERLLLTGHSHQCWPDVALQGQIEAWTDAAEHVDEKWERAFAKADRFRRGLRERLDDPSGQYAFGSNTHELLVRLLSALPLRNRARIVTTDGEYHSARRQFDRLAEEGVEIVRVPARPSADVAPRLVEKIDDRTCLVMVSHVLYQTGEIVEGLGAVVEAARRHGAALLVDAYHSVNVVPFSIDNEGLDEAFVVGGGYKYLQCGEGNCYLRFPAGCELRPVVTGWFAEFEALTEQKRPGEVAYGAGPWRFAEATYDPTSHYRAARVLDFFDEQRLDVATLRRISRHQIGLLASTFDDLDLDPAIIARDRVAPLERIAGFLALRSPHAGDLQRRLRQRGVLTDHRDDLLRFGPAPYLTDRQLTDAMRLLGEAAREIAPGGHQ